MMPARTEWINTYGVLCYSGIQWYTLLAVGNVIAEIIHQAKSYVIVTQKVDYWIER